MHCGRFDVMPENFSDTAKTSSELDPLRAAAESCVTASAAMPMTASRQTAVVIRLRRVRAFTATAGTGTPYFTMVSGAGRGGLRSGGAM